MTEIPTIPTDEKLQEMSTEELLDIIEGQDPEESETLRSLMPPESQDKQWNSDVNEQYRQALISKIRVIRNELAHSLKYGDQRREPPEEYGTRDF